MMNWWRTKWKIGENDGCIGRLLEHIFYQNCKMRSCRYLSIYRKYCFKLAYNVVMLLIQVIWIAVRAVF